MEEEDQHSCPEHFVGQGTETGNCIDDQYNTENVFGISPVTPIPGVFAFSPALFRRGVWLCLILKFAGGQNSRQAQSNPGYQDVGCRRDIG